MLSIVQVINKNKRPCHGERDRVNAEGCDQVTYQSKMTRKKTTTIVA